MVKNVMNRLIRLPEVEHLTGLKRSAIYLKIKEGRFPEQVKLGARSVAWRSEEIQKWIEDRPKARNR